jgi:2-hydroxy-3-keto-5-methylthiopentenyl-1-phosphate phosphatase
MNDFAASQPIDPSFPDFVDFCRVHGFEVYVLSDGMDAYIERIFKANGIEGITIRANHLEMDEGGGLTVSFPYFEDSCGQCANCKGTHIRRETLKEEKSIYVGDGYSDLCAIGAADILFAKDKLAEHCREQQIGFTPYSTFADVQREVGMIICRG